MRGVDRVVLFVVLALVIFGVLNLYSAGQTDVPTAAIGVWKRQLFWLGLGVVACWVMTRVSPRLL